MMVYIISITAGVETKKPGLIPGMVGIRHELLPFLMKNQQSQTADG